jgi:hypothetical protein
MTAVLANALHVFYPATYLFTGRIRQDADGALAVEEDKGIPWQSGQQSRRFLGVNLIEAKNVSLTSKK